MSVPQETEALIVDSIRGDTSAFEKLVRLYHGRVQYYVNRLLGDPDRAEDVMQNVWIAVYQQIGKLRSTRAFVVWLYQIARNQAYRELRQKIRSEASLTSIEEFGEDIPAQESDFGNADAELVHAGLQKLNPEQREALTLRFMEEMSYEEIAAVVGCNVGTVRSRLFYGKQALLEQIEAMRK